MTSAHIVIDDVSKHFALLRDTVVALDHVSLELRQGEFVALIGPSGCGKSTLLRMLADVTAPTEGSITIGGRTPEATRKSHSIGFVFQDPTLLPWRSVLDNVRLPIQIARGRGSRGAATPEELVELVGLSGFESAKPAQLSGGMRQRVAIARALALTPELLLMDEPFGALDEITRERLNDELLQLFLRQRFAALFITHSIAEAVFLSTRVLVMSNRPGEIVGDFAVPFPYPRSPELRFDPEFAQLCGDVSLSLRDAH